MTYHIEEFVMIYCISFFGAAAAFAGDVTEFEGTQSDAKWDGLNA